MEERTETVERNEVEISGLLWSLALATAIGTCLVMLASQLGGAKAEGRGIGNAFIFVELKMPSGESTIYRLPEGATLRKLFTVARIDQPIPQDIPCRSGDLVELRQDGTFTVKKMEGRSLILLGVKIPLNEASASDLSAIPGIGEALADRIIKARTDAGGFADWTAVRKVPGVGDHVFETLRNYTTM